MDVENSDKDRLFQYIKTLKELSSIILVFNFQQVRLPLDIKYIFKLLCNNLFPKEEIGNHIALVFTNSYTRKGKPTDEKKKKK